MLPLFIAKHFLLSGRANHLFYFYKQSKFKKAWRQVCIYAFPFKLLQEFAKVKNKTELEFEEDIEILRFLEMGYEVRMLEVSSTSISVDTKDDLKLVRGILNSTK